MVRYDLMQRRREGGLADFVVGTYEAATAFEVLEHAWSADSSMFHGYGELHVMTWVRIDGEPATTARLMAMAEADGSLPADLRPWRTVPIKVGATGHCRLAHPMAEPGPTPSGAVIWAVDDVPPVVTAAEVLEVFAATAIWRPGCYRVAFGELANERLLR